MMSLSDDKLADIIDDFNTISKSVDIAGNVLSSSNGGVIKMLNYPDTLLQDPSYAPIETGFGFVAKTE